MNYLKFHIRTCNFYQNYILIIALIFGTGNWACSQQTINTISKPNNGINPVMKISNLRSNEEVPMKIDNLKVDIKVIGQIAITTLDFTYFNSNNRNMEGEFSFPLSEGQSVSRFTLDINGQMREGVVVEKEQGRKTFEAIERRRVDPGLLEMTEGNNFRARVFPLPAKGYRRIIIAFEQELNFKGSGYLYQLPLNISEAVHNFSIHAEVLKQEVNPKIEENEIANFKFHKWEENYTADFKAENYIPTKQLAFLLPSGKKSLSGFTEPFGAGNDSSYFYLNVKSNVPLKEKELPKKIALYWDNSNSHQSADIEKELTVMDAYIHKIQNLSVVLVPFNIKQEKSQTFNIVNGNWDNLRNTLKGMIYDGGTSFGNLDITKEKCDEIILCTDGLSNFGKAELRLSNTPVIAINSNFTANHSVLNYIARQTGGQYLNLNKLTPAEAASLLSKADYHFISATVKQGSVSDLFVTKTSQINNTFSVSGIIKGTQAALALNFGFGNVVTESKDITVSTINKDTSGIIKRQWAGNKIEKLNCNPELNKREITNTGKAFGIITPYTSLIVLESLQDYVRFHIVPPAEMQNEYFSMVKNEENNKSTSIKDHINYVAGLFEDRVKWWNTTYTKTSHSTSIKATVQFVPPTIAYDEEVVTDANAVSPDVEMIVEETSSNVAANSIVESVTTDKKKAIEDNYKETQSSIQLNAWDPQTPYLKVLQYAAKGDEYKTYLKLKTEYGSTPLFYADACDFFIKLGEKEVALRILSNLAELKLEEPQLLRILGTKLIALKQTSVAVDIYEHLLTLKGEDPQSYRDLGLAYEADGNPQKAIQNLYEVVKRDWDGRFPEIELIALEEINRIIANSGSKTDYSFIDPRLIKNLPVDIRVVLSWDTDNCDMDLWVTDPYGEKCFYQHTLTEIGGIISKDFTRGYGPEEFLLKNAANGKYMVQANYYGTSTQNLLAPVTLHLIFYTNYGKPSEKSQETVIRLENKNDVIDIGSFVFGPSVAK
jgi:tetratricopeptide (TPR) repeat protein